MQFSEKYRNQIYAGVLGKMIGVYLGRPVEGWPYEQIVERFGEVGYYVNGALNLPLIVADDDLSGAFAFFRAMEDNGMPSGLTARQVGDAWLNYIIEDRTILWWGGRGNSTEHTAYLNLKNGVPAPRSGAIETNGPVLSQQIGAQIFMDAYAMMCPCDPERAAYFVRQCAGVSHDGIALEAACFLGALEAAAFDERNLDKLFDGCSRFVTSDLLRRVVGDVRSACARHTDWREVRAFLDKHYGYEAYPGPCHMVPNHAMVLASILMGGDDFARSVRIAASAAWDTDCNAGNVGCFNGIRLGLDALAEGPDFRGPVRDRLYVITADGGEGITDAVRETRRIVQASAALRGEDAEIPKARFAFEYSGSVQGFEPCPYAAEHNCAVALSNANEANDGNGLKIQFAALAAGCDAHVSTATFLDIREEYCNYETFVSPTLYSGQRVTARLSCREPLPPRARLYVWYADAGNELHMLQGPETRLQTGDTTLQWTVPDTGGMPILRFGLAFSSDKRFCGGVILRSADWSNTPERFEQRGILMRDMWDLNPFFAKMFVSSAKNFAPNLRTTYCVSHGDGCGLATIGTRDFTDYTVTSSLKMSLHERGGLVLRSRGHRRYYAALLCGGNSLRIVKRVDGVETVLAEAPVAYAQFEELTLRFGAQGNRLTAAAKGVELSAADEDAPILSGAAGYLVDTGAMFINGFLLESNK